MTLTQPLVAAGSYYSTRQFPGSPFCISNDLDPCCVSRVMSQYPPTYREPVLPPEQEADTRQQLAFSPVKAAPSDLTSSAFDHPAVK